MKKILFITSLWIIPLITSAQNEKGELRGVVTYFFNDNYGTKPDVGAKIIIQKINFPTERSPEEIKLDSDLVRLIQDTMQLEETIKKEEKDIVDIDTTKKKVTSTKNRPAQATKEKSFKEALDAEQKKHGVILDTFGKFDTYREPGNLVIEFYNKEEVEAKRHCHAQMNIIDTFSKVSGENEMKLKLRGLLANREQNLTILRIDKDRYQYLSNDLRYKEDVCRSTFQTKKMLETMDINSSIFWYLRRAEAARGYLNATSDKQFKNRQIEELKAVNAYPEDKFNELDNRAYKIISDIENSRDTKITTADGSGNYSIKLEPGIYYLVIKSKGRKDHSLTESGGQISGIDIINIKSNETIEKSEEFKGGY